MRTRTVVGAVTSALLIGVWSAPAALAAEAPDDGKAPPTSSAAPGPGDGESKSRIREFKAAEPPTSATESSSTSAPAPKAPEPKPAEPKLVVPDPVVPNPVPEPVEPKAALALNPAQVKPGEQFQATGACTPGDGTLSASRDVSMAGSTGKVSDGASAGDIEITLKCLNGGKTAEVSKTLKVLAAPNSDRPGIRPIAPGGPNPGDKRARLSVPDQLYPGDRFKAVTSCPQGDGSLGGQFVRFTGLDGIVDDNAAEGRFGVTLRCPDSDEITEYFYVKRKFDGFDGKARLNLNPHSGERGDEVDIRAYCPGNGRGRFESDGLDDVRLRLDGGRLTGETHVEREAHFGRTSGRLICDNGDRDWARFYVERDEHDRFLDLDENYGRRGDDVDVRVHCDRDLKELESDVLKDITLDRDGDDWWKFSGTTHVQDDAEYGEHTIRIKCGDDWLEDDFFVKGGGGGDDGDDQGDSGEQAGLYPKGGVETGGGPADGLPLGAVALGLTGVLGAALAGAGSACETRGVRR